MAKILVSRQNVDENNQLSWELVEVEEEELLPHEVPSEVTLEEFNSGDLPPSFVIWEAPIEIPVLQEVVPETPVEEPAPKESVPETPVEESPSQEFLPTV